MLALSGACNGDQAPAGSPADAAISGARGDAAADGGSDEQPTAGRSASNIDPQPNSGGSGSPEAGSGGRLANASGGRIAADSGSETGNGGESGGSAQGSELADEPVTCAGTPGELRGKSDQTLVVGERERTFIYYAPAALAATRGVPLVFIAHGFGMSADMMYDITQYTDLADREQFVAVFLNGQPNAPGPWNVGEPDCGTSDGNPLPVGSGDDQAYLDAVLDFAKRDQCIDERHVYMTGFSMGAYFTHETACQRPWLRAAAPHSGGTHELTSCASEHKPMLILHFADDALVPFSCAEQARDRWAAHNGCQLTGPEVVTVNAGRCEYYTCPADGQVGLCEFSSPNNDRSLLYPGHGWAGGSQTGSSGASYAIPDTASASELSYQFFKQYAW